MVRRAFMFLLGIVFIAVGIIVAPLLSSTAFTGDPVSIFFPIFPVLFGLFLLIGSFRAGEDVS